MSRLGNSLSKSYKRAFKLGSADKDIVIISYCWMMPFNLKKKRGSIYSIDTHDVNFVRDELYYKDGGITINFLNRINRFLEMRLLKKADKIIAISDNDEQIFKDSGFSDKVMKLWPGFDWIQSMAKTSRKTVSFGFIGSNMIANRIAMDYIAGTLWPVIIKARPESKLYIAGAIGDYVTQKMGRTRLDSVITLGFVPSLNHYYTIIDATLSPVFMQGGMNFKIVESLCAGVPVFTNSTGAKSIPETKMMFVNKNENNLDKQVEYFLKLVDDLLAEPASLKDMSFDLQKKFDLNFQGSLNILLKSKG